MPAITLPVSPRSASLGAHWKGLDHDAARGHGVVEHDRDPNANDGCDECDEDLKGGSQPNPQ